MTYANGDFFPPGGVRSRGDVACVSEGPLEAVNRSEGGCMIAGANGAYDLGLGCRSWTAMGAGLGTATAVDMSTEISFELEALPEHNGGFVVVGLSAGVVLFLEVLYPQHQSRALRTILSKAVQQEVLLDPRLLSRTASD